MLLSTSGRSLASTLGCTLPLASHAALQFHTSSPAATSECIHYDEITNGAAAPQLTALVVHGLLGAGKNLRTFAKTLVDRAEDSGVRLRAVLVDQRNHGRSARCHLHPPHNLQASARDLIQLFQKNFEGRLPELVIGHSMGGKVALELVKQLGGGHAALGSLKQVWVLDARPGKVDASSGVLRDVERVLRAVREVPLPVPSRQWLAQQLQQKGFSPGITQWLGSNLTYEGKDRYTWTFNVDGAQQMFEAYCRTDYFPVLRSPPPGVTINMLRAAKSDRWDSAAVQAIKEAAASTGQSTSQGVTRFFELPNAGHWVHVDNLNGLIDIVLPSVMEAAKS